MPYRRVIREALMSFRHYEVDDCPMGERAFELALSRPYQLFILALPLRDLVGQILGNLISRAHPLAHRGIHTAPTVIFITRAAEAAAMEAMKRDVWLRGCLSYPPKLDELLTITAGLLPEKQPSLPHVS
jgi:hypothetical protein